MPKINWSNFFNRREVRQAIFFDVQTYDPSSKHPELQKPIQTHKTPVADSSAKIFCFDWDHTITNNHCHSELEGARNSQEAYDKKYSELINDDKNVPEKARLLKIFRGIINSKDRLAITSYSSHPAFMYDKLKAIGLTHNELSKITIVYEIGNQGKNTHIKSACESFGVKPEKANVVLIDDDVASNIYHANQAGAKKVFANVTTVICNHTEGNAHLDQLENLIEKPKKAEKSEEKSKGFFSSINYKYVLASVAVCALCAVGVALVIINKDILESALKVAVNHFAR